MYEEFIAWVWGRHHNILSWYVRPFFILPYCYFSYHRKLSFVLLTLLLLPTTLFWFPAPDKPSEKVIQYLAWEQEFLLNAPLVQKVILLILVVIFLVLLSVAFWKRSLVYGLVVLNVGTGLKVMWSIFFAGGIGMASLLPSVVTLFVCNTAFLLYWVTKST